MSALPTIASLWKIAKSNRRDSVSSGSSGASSLESMRPKKRGGNPLSRARTMARFVRQVCGTRSPPVFHVGLHRLATFEFVDSESDDGVDDGEDEQAFPIVTVV
ncbi:hypothetical protein L226DRAFT_573495 [Lentinus tigrinus ALCF2SS1-7]|uniref:Uncharacterized protein n=1 Tax=Lentinus tigrinus ALCF2SS1-6 TaxID=1328759 RepID=A0A5C2S7Z9_9APHY|nr:hypothetical protein L227DRAFT_613773 [Lentinus tigrinus ALCF2SS1-6]RPD72144.1 hypothetical protein L226DRAFT_573495 [Lentinus tigrinus ALCF2SS1-7]